MVDSISRRKGVSEVSSLTVTVETLYKKKLVRHIATVIRSGSVITPKGS